MQSEGRTTNAPSGFGILFFCGYSLIMVNISFSYRKLPFWFISAGILLCCCVSVCLPGGVVTYLHGEGVE